PPPLRRRARARRARQLPAMVPATGALGRPLRLRDGPLVHVVGRPVVAGKPNALRRLAHPRPRAGMRAPRRLAQTVPPRSHRGGARALGYDPGLAPLLRPLPPPLRRAGDETRQRGAAAAVEPGNPSPGGPLPAALSAGRR